MATTGFDAPTLLVGAALALLNALIGFVLFGGPPRGTPFGGTGGTRWRGLLAAALLLLGAVALPVHVPAGALLLGLGLGVGAAAFARARRARGGAHR